MSDYRVTAGYVTVETKINDKGARAQVDISRGADLPGDVPDEQIQTLLRLGNIEPADGAAPVEEAAAEVNEDVDADDLDELDKDALVKVAEEQGVGIDKRWSADKIAAAIREHRQQ